MTKRERAFFWLTLGSGFIIGVAISPLVYTWWFK